MLSYKNVNAAKAFLTEKSVNLQEQQNKGGRNWYQLVYTSYIPTYFDTTLQDISGNSQQSNQIYHGSVILCECKNNHP